MKEKAKNHRSDNGESLGENAAVMVSGAKLDESAIRLGLISQPQCGEAI